MAYYAWGEIRFSEGEKHIVIDRGQKLERKDLAGISDADWNALIEGGSVRDKPFPAPSSYQGSALDFLRESLQEAMAVSPVEEEEAFHELKEVDVSTGVEEVAAAKQAPRSAAKSK